MNEIDNNEITTAAPKRTFSKTRRYTKRVKFMRIFLPLIAFGILITLFTLPFFSDTPIVRKKNTHHAQTSTTEQAEITQNNPSRPNVPDPPVSATEDHHKDALQMTKPRFDGLDSKGRPFTVIADTVSQDESDLSANMTLKNPVADIQLSSTQAIAITAQSGLYNQKEQKITLTGDVSLFHDNGYSLTSETMTIDINTGYATTDTSTFLYGNMGSIDGLGGFVLEDFGNHITFKGPAKLILQNTGKNK